MTDSSNVVIKIKYKESDKSPYDRSEPDVVTEWHYQRIVFAVLALVTFIVFPFYYFSDGSVEKQVEKLTVATETKSVEKKILKAVDKEPLKIELIKGIEKDVGINKDSDTKKNVDTRISKPVELIKKEQIVIGVKPVDKVNRREKVEAENTVTQGLVDKRIIRALLTTGLNDKEPLEVIVSPIIVSKDKAAGIFYFTEMADMKGLDLYHHWLWNDRVIYNKNINILGDRWRATTSKVIPYAKAGSWSVRLVNDEGIILNEIKFKVIQQ